MSEMSTEIDKLAAALAKAQGKITGAKKESSNPFFESKYADLASCWDACREALCENGLSVVQTAEGSFSEEGPTIFINTMLMHESGQWMRSTLPMLPKDASPQATGSIITYGRRYGLCAMLGIAQVDDDANAGNDRERKTGAVHDPRPQGWKAADTRKATADAKRLIDASVEMPHTIKSLWEELKVDEAYAAAVWQKLPSPVKDLIREQVKAA